MKNRTIELIIVFCAIGIIVVTFIQMLFPVPQTAHQTVSVLAEKEKCDKWGGQIHFQGLVPMFPSFGITEPITITDFSCTKDVIQIDKDGTTLSGTKTLFSYDF